MTRILAHRGCTDGFVENTMAAFVEAERRGADGIELDVRRSADGALVVHHDALIEGLGPICALNVEELPAHIPLLSTVLSTLGDLVINVEIKNDPREAGYEADQAIAAAVASAVMEARAPGRVLISSFQSATLDAVRAAEPSIGLGWLIGPVAEPLAFVDQAHAAGYDALHPFVLNVDDALVTAARRVGMAINTWTVNARHDLVHMLELGVDSIITDDLNLGISLAGQYR